MSTSYDVPTARKTIRLIELLCTKKNAMGVTEIAQEMELSKNMVFRLLQTLSDTGWVIKENGSGAPRYRMSLQAFRCSSQLVQNLDFKTAVEEPLLQLWKDTGECVHASVLDGDRVLIIGVHETSGHIVKVDPQVGGGGSDLHVSGPGKVMLAHGSDEFVKRFMAKGLSKRTDKTITTKTALLDDLKFVREKGYGLDREEGIEGIMCLAAPVFNYDGKLEGAICVSVLTMYYTLKDFEKELGPVVKECAMKVSERLGWEMKPPMNADGRG